MMPVLFLSKIVIGRLMAVSPTSDIINSIDRVVKEAGLSFYKAGIN